MRWHGKILSGFTEAGIPSSYPEMFCWPSQPLSKALPTAAPEPLHPLVCLQGRLCFLDQCFLNAGRKDGTCWLQIRCQSMQRGLYCKQSLKIHFKRRKGWGEEKQNTQRCWLAIYSHPPLLVINHLPLWAQQTSYTHSSSSLLLARNLIFWHAFCRIQNTFVLWWAWGKGVSLLSRYATSMYYRLGAPPHPGSREPFVAAWSHSSGTRWTFQAGDSGSVNIAGCGWRSICSWTVEVPSESSKN